MTRKKHTKCLWLTTLVAGTVLTTGVAYTATQPVLIHADETTSNSQTNNVVHQKVRFVDKDSGKIVGTANLAIKDGSLDDTKLQLPTDYKRTDKFKYTTGSHSTDDLHYDGDTWNIFVSKDGDQQVSGTAGKTVTMTITTTDNNGNTTTTTTTTTSGSSTNSGDTNNDSTSGDPDDGNQPNQNSDSSSDTDQSNANNTSSSIDSSSDDKSSSSEKNDQSDSTKNSDSSDDQGSTTSPSDAKRADSSSSGSTTGDGQSGAPASGSSATSQPASSSQSSQPGSPNNDQLPQTNGSLKHEKAATFGLSGLLLSVAGGLFKHKYI